MTVKKLYLKSPLTFALVLVALYVVLGSVLEGLSSAHPLGYLLPLAFHLALAPALLTFLAQGALLRDFGLCAPARPARELLFYLPLVLVPLVNFLYPIAALAPLPTAARALSMLLVGLIEELIFRGFLLRAMYTNSPRAAVVVSSVTFGIGHIVNLLSGAPPVATLLQIVYATVYGFLFVVLLFKSKSLLPAILTHSALNATSVFVDTATRGETFTVLSALALTALGLVYLFYLLQHNRKSEHKGETK